MTYSEQDILMTNDEEARAYAMQLSLSPTLPMVLTTAVELGLLDMLAAEEGGKGVTAAEMAAQLPAVQNPDERIDMLDRMLRLLTAFSVVTCSVKDGVDGAVERLYGITPAGRFLVRGDGGEGSMASVLEVNTSRFAIDTWYHFKEIVLEGKSTTTFEKAHGRTIFKYINMNPELNNLFNRAMENMTKLVTQKVIETYKGFEGVRVLVDVGGGTGSFLNLVLSVYPNIRGINFDLPPVVETAPFYHGIEHVGGDMFEKIPDGDAILIKGVLHNWEDEHCMKILKRCHEALPEKGKVIIIDSVPPNVVDLTNKAKFVFQLDLIMLAMFRGKERTLNELKAISQAIGFKSIHLVCSVNAVSIIELLK